MTTTSQPSGLWSDEPTADDLLSFDAVAVTAADALLDDRLDPVALGLSGPWGSGKTTVLGLVGKALAARDTDEAKVIVVSGNSQKKVYEQLEKEGAAAFVAKPIKEEDLTAAIARATRP